MIVREVELLKMMQGEEGAIGMEGAIKHAASKVQSSDMPCFQVTSDPIPQAAVCTLFPRLCLGMLAIPWSRAINGKGFFELEQRKTLVKSTEMRWRNSWMDMEEKQNERERWNRWKPHVWLALQDSEYIWERWGMKKDIIYRQSNLRLYTDWHRMCKTCKDEIKSQETTRVSEWVSEWWKRGKVY